MMQLYFLATFLSAFLLFQVQPLIGKSILPWFGGAPAVWTTCMLFFQITLLAGYFYAYLVTRYLQGYLHGALLLISLLLLPIIPSIAWKPTDGNDPTILILILLLTTVGGPYLLLSATAPLLQSWFYETYQKPPFRLYALSNGASLIALFTYPLLIEPFLGSTAQALVWSCGYILFAVICSLLAFFSKIKPVKRVQLPLPSYKAIILWLLLSATGSIVLLATTNQLCLDLAPVPFLWVLPLSLYLLSFVICFDAASWYRRSWFNVLLVIMILCNIIYIGQMIHFHFIQIILLLSLSLFISCMTCHGELVRLKPDPKYLSLFYLMIALGGALGGIFVTIISPMIFVQFDEYSIGLILTSLLALITIRYERGASLGKFTWVFAGFVCFFLLLLNGYNEKTSSDGVLDRKRNFYGTLRIVRKDSADAEKDHIAMSHGTTIHGYQFQKNELKRTPTAYYSKDSGIGLALTHHPKGNHLRVGVVGLGCGTLSAYMEKGDYIAFYEINQNVLDLSRQYFTFEKDALLRGATVDMFMGDARIVMERQPPKDFDILAIDAFSSDSIPMHLLTKECFAIYLSHLNADGILAFHISNRFLDISPIIKTFAERSQKNACSISLESRSYWILVTNNQTFLNNKQILEAIDPETEFSRIEWTDGYSSLFPLLK